jgi:hypothetical protein
MHRKTAGRRPALKKISNKKNGGDNTKGSGSSVYLIFGQAMRFGGGGGMVSAAHGSANFRLQVVPQSGGGGGGFCYLPRP